MVDVWSFFEEQGMLKLNLELPGLVFNFEAPLPLIAWIAFSVSWMLHGRKADARQSEGDGVDLVVTKSTRLFI